MNHYKIFTAGHSAALDYAIHALKRCNHEIVASSETATHLLLPVPSFLSDGSLQGGGNLEELLSRCPKAITVIGGNLKHPALTHYKTVDLLQDPLYLAENANITAHCAISLAMHKLPFILPDCPVLIIGWGRIGKCLTHLLQAIGCNVTVAARKDADRAMLQALGYNAISPDVIKPNDYALLFNTVPATVLTDCMGDSLKIDLASCPGMTGEGIIWARGLPSKDAPASSGALIAQTVIRLLKKEEEQL